jgi:hypothetical protein
VFGVNCTLFVDEYAPPPPPPPAVFPPAPPPITSIVFAEFIQLLGTGNVVPEVIVIVIVVGAAFTSLG